VPLQALVPDHVLDECQAEIEPIRRRLEDGNGRGGDPPPVRRRGGANRNWADWVRRFTTGAEQPLPLA
jgi:hypothetical protein